MRPMKNLQQIIHKYVCVRKFQALTFNIVTYRNFSSNRSNDDTFSLAVDNEKWVFVFSKMFREPLFKQTRQILSKLRYISVFALFPFKAAGITRLFFIFFALQLNNVHESDRKKKTFKPNGRKMKKQTSNKNKNTFPNRKTYSERNVKKKKNGEENVAWFALLWLALLSSLFCVFVFVPFSVPRIISLTFN